MAIKPDEVVRSDFHMNNPEMFPFQKIGCANPVQIMNRFLPKAQSYPTADYHLSMSPINNIERLKSICSDYCIFPNLLQKHN